MLCLEKYTGHLAMDQPKKSQSCELLSSQKEKHNYHGVVCHSPTKADNDPLINGTLSLIQESNEAVIEWKPNDVSIDADYHDEPEWELVKTNTRTRTSSGSSLPKLHVSIPLEDVKSIKVSQNNNKLVLALKDDQQKTFFFHFGNVSNFLGDLQNLVDLKRSREDYSLYIVHDKRTTSSRTFADLSLIEKVGEHSVWNLVDGLKKRPYETTLSTFSKFTEYLLYRTPENRPPEENMVELLYTMSTLPGGSGENNSDVDETYHFIRPIMGPRQLEPRGSPLSHAQWEAAKDEKGRITEPDTIKDIIFKGGITPSLRPEVWKYLLGFYSWNSSEKERADILKHKTEEYRRMKTQWSTLSEEQISRFTVYHDRKSIVEKDVNRTDRTMPFFAGVDNPNLKLLSDVLMTHVMYNFDLGYVQGMSDLLSPLLIVLEDEVEAFWCFVNFMHVMVHNFDEDQYGMKKQLSQLHTLLTAVAPDLATYFESTDAGSLCFCFRWLLVWFKREFPLEDIYVLWEVLWTLLPCRNFHLVICVAILEKEKDTIMKSKYGLSEVLKHVNDLSYQMDLDDVLVRAAAIYKQLEQSLTLTASTQRVLGIAQDVSTGKNYATRRNIFETPTTRRTEQIKNLTGETLDDMVSSETSDNVNNDQDSDLNIENSYEKSIEHNYF